MIFDGKGLKCPLAFVKAKQSLLKHSAKKFIFDDDISLYNFTSYLDNQHIGYRSNTLIDCVEIDLIDV